MTIPKKLIANFLLFQLAWNCAVFLPAIWDSIIPLCVLLIHLIFIAKAREYLFILLCVAIGVVVDSIFAWLGLLQFYPAVNFAIPIWLLLIWANFATTFCHSLLWLQRNFALSFALGFIVGPLTYYLGSMVSIKLTFNYNLWGLLLAYAVVWGLLCALLPKLRPLHKNHLVKMR